LHRLAERQQRHVARVRPQEQRLGERARAEADDADPLADDLEAVADRAVPDVAVADRALDSGEPRLDVDDTGRKEHGSSLARERAARRGRGPPVRGEAAVDARRREADDGARIDRDTAASGMSAHAREEIGPRDAVRESRAI